LSGKKEATVKLETKVLEEALHEVQEQTFGDDAAGLEDIMDEGTLMYQAFDEAASAEDTAP
jgi:hypothetical protein